MFLRLKGGIVRFFENPYPLSWHLVVLVLAGMLPLLFFSYFVVQKLAYQDRQASERRLAIATREMAASVDQEFESTIRTLNALTVSEYIQRHDLRGFHAEIKKIKGTQPSWSTILLHAAEGAILLSANRRFEEKLEPPADPSSIRRLVESGEPGVGKVVAGPIGSKLENKHIFAVRVPIVVDGRIQYVLSAVIAVEILQGIVSKSLSDEWTRTIIDREGTIAARSRDPENFVGTRATEEFLDLLQTKKEGLRRATTRDGQEVYASFASSRLSGWTSSIAVPVAALEAPIRTSMLLVSSGGLILVLIFGALAFRYSKHLASSIRSAGQGAEALARGESPEVMHSRVSEVVQLRKALRESADLLLRRDEARKAHLMEAQNARVEAEAANRAKSDFLANMSHEIRTPLGAIMGFAELLRDPEISDRERRDYLNSILRNGKLLTQVISDILDLSKVEAGKIPVEKERFSLPNLIAEVRELFGPQARAKGVGLKIKMDSGVPERIETDSTKLKQILINLIGNAIKFTNEGDVRLTVNASPDDEVSTARTISFLVEDTGCGIAPEHFEKLFKPFSQSDESVTRKYGGTGLGLLLSRRLAQVLGGDVELLGSALNEGSSFVARIETPWTSGTVSDFSLRPQPSIGGLGSLSGDRLSGSHILLVEDSPDNQLLITRILKREGAKVDIAHDGHEGVELAQKGHYNIVLMDLQMPVKSGFEAASELRANGYQNPIIAVTAAALKEEREKALRMGFDDHMTKPIDARLLVDKIAEYIHAGEHT